jgi:hypothetical protein
VRRDGRVTAGYLGAGPMAIPAEHQLERERAARQAHRRALRRLVRSVTDCLDEPREDVEFLCAVVDALFRQAMVFRGYYLHKRRWRRRGRAMMLPGSPGFWAAVEA